jgi:Protein of unknown function (DUF3995)
VVGLLLAASGVALHLATRGAHPAWPVFLVGALAIASAEVPGAGREWIALTGAAVSLGIAALHFGWAAGLRWGLRAALPEVNGEPHFRPGRLLTAGVGFALVALAAVFAALGGLVQLPLATTLGGLAALVFVARTVGDFRTVGLFKRVRRGTFARLDSLVYTPLCFALAAALVWLR